MRAEFLGVERSGNLDPQPRTPALIGKIYAFDAENTHNTYREYICMNHPHISISWLPAEVD